MKTKFTLCFYACFFLILGSWCYATPLKTANTYDPLELNGLRAFLRQTDTAGVLNLTKLGLEVNDTVNWTTDETWVSKVNGLSWNTQTPKKITEINWGGKGLSGTLDASAFTALEYLDCSSNRLTSLDVSKNTVLEELRCYSNPLTSLDVSKNTALYGLYCYSNRLTSLDVSKNTALEQLSCSYSPLTSLDVSKNTALESLECYSNQFTSLDVSKNTVLENLYCSYNQLTSLDVSKNTALKRLECDYNRLTSLDVSKNTALERLWCDSNSLMLLDVSKNTALKQLSCSYNRLPLSTLYTFMTLRGAVLELGMRTQESIFFTDTTLAVNGSLDLSSESEFGGVKTKFEVNTGSENYTINEGVIRFLKKGTYQISLSNDSIWDVFSVVTAKTGIITVDNVSSEDILSGDEISIFPNPSSNKLFIKGQKPIRSLILYNLNGSILQKIENPESEVEINISNLVPGIYLLNIDGYTKKIVKK